MNEVICNRMHELISRILDQNESTALTQAFYDYCRPLANRKSLATYIRHKLDTVHLGRRQVQDSVVLDAGCGFGITSLLFALSGAKETYGVDVMESRLSVFKAYLERLSLGLAIYPKLQSVSALDYPADFFDIVFSNEAISHYRDLKGFLREMHRVLKKGGVLVVADSNNGDNPSLMRKSKKIWDRFERGPAGSVGQHRVEKPYVIMRHEIIQERFPQLRPDELDSLSQGTFGMDRAEVLEACQTYVQSGRMPKSFYTGKECPLNPTTGAVIERFFHPLKLAREMQTYGLRARAYAYFGGAAGTPYLRIANKFLSGLTPLTINFALGFRIVARKED